MLNIHDSMHMRPLLNRLIEGEPSWKETLLNSDWHVKFVHPGIEDPQRIEYLMQKGKVINKYPNCWDLTRKDVQSDMMKFISTQSEDDYDLMPATFTLPGKFEAQRLEEYMSANKGAFYIAKPQNGGQGDGMHIFKDWKDVSGSVSKGSECVVQRYIDKPLTLEGVKFDLRVYVVVIGVGEQMRGYICDEGLARFCTVRTSFITLSLDKL